VLSCMDPALVQFYEKLVLKHSRHPQHTEPAEPCTHHARATNPLCGDEITLTMRVTDGVIEAIGCDTQGCAISQASASLLAEAVEGKTLEEATTLLNAAVTRLRTDPELCLSAEASELETFLQAARNFPARLNCAQLSWDALRAALDAKSQSSRDVKPDSRTN